MPINVDTPKQGDVWIFAPEPGSKMGHEQEGYRPHLVISVFEKNAITHSVTCVPITNTDKPYPSRVPVPAGFEVHEGEELTGFIETEHVNSYDFQARHATYTCTLPEATVKKVLKTVLLSLGTQAS